MTLQEAATGPTRADSSRPLLTPSALALPLLSAAAVIGLGELIIHRVGGAAAGAVEAPAWLGDAMRSGGRALMAAAALLTFALALVLISLLKESPWPRFTIGLAAVFVLAFPLLVAYQAEWTAHVAVMLAMTVVVGSASGSVAHRAAVSLIGLGFVTAQAVLIVTESGLALRMGAEAALVVGVIVLAVTTVRDGSVAAKGWTGAVIAGTAVAFALTFQPGYTAMTSFWTLGVTLSLPPLLYIAAGTASGLLIANSIGDSTRRHFAAGLVLLAVAGLTPTLAHHNLTAVLALAVLASAHWPTEAKRSR